MKMRQYLAGDGQAGEAVETAADDVPVMVVKAEQGLYTVGKLRLPSHGEEEAVYDEDDDDRRPQIHQAERDGRVLVHGHGCQRQGVAGGENRLIPGARHGAVHERDHEE